MGWYFRRGINLGPFRVNLSRSGVGWSVGRRGARIGVDAKGRRTTHASIPGTGLGHRSVGRRGAKGCLGAVAVGVAASLLAGGFVAVAAGLGALALLR
jgi:hypothetical protein